MGDYHVTTLIILFIVQIQSQKILSDTKKCGDTYCESMMMRVSAKQDYTGPDCRFLSFKTGEEINVYYKLTGEREDLWQGSKGKAYGFFPKDAVSIEEIFMTEEIEVLAQEIDFICLNGGEYFFENEDSVLHKENEDILLMGENTATDGGIPTQVDVTHQELDKEAPDKSDWGPSGIAVWFGMGRAHDKQDIKTDVNLNQEDGLPNRETAINEQVEPKELEENQAEISGWLGGDIKKSLPFREGDTEAEPLEEDRDTLTPHENIAGETDGVNISAHTQEPDQENNNSNDSGEPQAKWFNFAIKDVLSFATKNELKKEELHQSVDEGDDERTSKNRSPKHGESMDINGEGDKVDVSVVGQWTDDETKSTEINPGSPTEDIAVTSAPEKDESFCAAVGVSTQCESEETAASEHCTFKSTSDQPYRKPHHQEESCAAGVQPPSDISILPLAEILMSLFWKYFEDHSPIVGPLGSPVTNAIHKVLKHGPREPKQCKFSRSPHRITNEIISSTCGSFKMCQ